MVIVYDNLFTKILHFFITNFRNCHLQNWSNQEFPLHTAKYDFLCLKYSSTRFWGRLRAYWKEEMKSGKKSGISKSFNHFKVFPCQLSHLLPHSFTRQQLLVPSLSRITGRLLEVEISKTCLCIKKFWQQGYGLGGNVLLCVLNKGKQDLQLSHLRKGTSHRCLKELKFWPCLRAYVKRPAVFKIVHLIRVSFGVFDLECWFLSQSCPRREILEENVQEFSLVCSHLSERFSFTSTWVWTPLHILVANT